MPDQGYFSLEDCKVAPWTDATTWGTAVDVYGVNVFGLSLRMLSGEHIGDGALIATHAQVIAMNCEVQFLMNGLALWATLLGKTLESGATDKGLVIDRVVMPYLGIIGKVLVADSGAGQLEVFLPKIKINQDIQIVQATAEGFITPRLQAQAVYNDATYGFGKLIDRASVGAVTIPPAALA